MEIIHNGDFPRIVLRYDKEKAEAHKKLMEEVNERIKNFKIPEELQREMNNIDDMIKSLFMDQVTKKPFGSGIRLGRER